MDSTQRLARSLIVIAMSAALSACGGGGSSPVAVAPVIQAQPADQSVTAAGTARFTVSAAGDGLTYQWELSTSNGASWTAVPGATQPTLELAGVSAVQNGHQYRVVVTGSSGSVISSPVTLRVTVAPTAPVILANVPASPSAVAGTNVNLSVTASGTTPAYRWQVSSNGTTWTDVPGATASTLSLVGVTVGQNGLRYRVIVSNSAGSVTSAVATLQVTAAPAAPGVAAQPQPAAVVAPNAATFTVVGTGTPAPTIQWQRSTDAGVTFNDISGATSTSYSTGSTATSLSGQLFRAVLTNPSGSITSTPALLTVAAAPVAPSFSTQPLNASADVGAVANFTVVVSGSPAPTIQWQVSTDGGATFNNITGATAATYTTPVLTNADNGKRYRAVATNNAGAVNSAIVALTVNAVPRASARNCYSVEQYTTPSRLAGAYSEVLVGGVAQPDLTVDVTGHPTVNFRGTAAFERTTVERTSRVDASSRTDRTVTIRDYYTIGGDGLPVQRGRDRQESTASSLASGASLGSTAASQVEIWTSPGLPLGEFGLAEGGTYSVQNLLRVEPSPIVTRNGAGVVIQSIPRDAFETTVALRTQFLGINDSYTVPAGRFRACGFEIRQGTSVVVTEWVEATTGRLLSRTTVSGPSTVIRTLTAVR
jgi:hypothetical protein